MSPRVDCAIGSFRVLAALSCLALTGCGYVHFGRLPKDTRSGAELQEAYTNLSLERKILKEEISILRRDTENLRAALERGPAAGSPAQEELSRQLAQTTKELATLRAANASREIAAQKAPVLDPEAVAKQAAALQAENVRLKRELDESRQENATLAQNLKVSLEAHQQSQETVTRLNTDLTAEKQARERAEQVTLALRAQLEAVMARAGRAESASTASPRPAPSDNRSALRLAREPSSGAVPSAELYTSRGRLLAGATPAAALESKSPTTTAAGPQVAAPAARGRTYTVQPGDTLEKISVRVYGAADQWGRLYDANRERLGSGGLKSGMELVVPE